MYSQQRHFLGGGNNRKNFLGESRESRLLEAKGTVKHIPRNMLFSHKMKVPLQNKWPSMQKFILQKVKDFAKNLRLNFTLLWTLFFSWQGRSFYFLANFSSSLQGALSLNPLRFCENLSRRICLLFSWFIVVELDWWIAFQKKKLADVVYHIKFELSTFFGILMIPKSQKRYFSMSLKLLEDQSSE